jgi:hypothetical protein
MSWSVRGLANKRLSVVLRCLITGLIALAGNSKRSAVIFYYSDNRTPSCEAILWIAVFIKLGACDLRQDYANFE